MNEEIIRKYAGLMKELELTGLEISENDTKIRLERGVQGTVLAEAPVSVQTASAAPEQSKEKIGFEEVLSPMVGVFYEAPAENAEPFVKKGDKVKKGDTLCIIEAMKLMNEVTAEQDGTIQEICVKNGDTVEYGTVLFLIGE
ncbi:MAG: acetyl-CoA carboxylase biotin carboxyl carrier protein [Parasporobacterium sp.]|nr:acetyl-CoA carboxylase biotin carboxyl carrier protein [Parasporobacterium sp.]